MAPRRGGGSSKSGGGGSSSSCDMCNVPYYMSSTGFDTPTARAVLALEFLSILVIVACLIVVAKRPWLELSGKKDRFKYWTYVGSGLSALVYLAIAAVDSILHQVEIETTYAYFIIYIFRSLAWRVSDVLMIAVILRCLEGGRSAMIAKQTKLRIVHWVAIIIVSILAIVAWSLYTRYIAGLLSADYSDAVDATAPLEMTYSAVAFVISLEMLALVLFLAVKKAIPLKSLLLLAGAAVAYWLSTLLNLIFYATVEYDFSSYSESLGWANSFIAILTLMAVFILLAMLSQTSNKRTRQLTTKGGQVASVTEVMPDKWEPNPQQNHQGLNSDTTYHGGGYQGQEWQPVNSQTPVGGYSNTNSQDPAAQPLYPSQAPGAQPLYPSQAYNPPQQAGYGYDNVGPQTYIPDQRYYGNGPGYASVPQNIR